MDTETTTPQNGADITAIEARIKKLFQTRWTDNLAKADIDDMKAQLYKNLLDQVRGYWSGHTAYHLMVDGGFLVDGDRSTHKQLTADGEAFMAAFEADFREQEWALVVDLITAGNQAQWDRLAELINDHAFGFFSQAQSAAIMAFNITDEMVRRYPKAAAKLATFNNDRRWGFAESFRQSLIEQYLEKHQTS
jgi:hypothetical protein